MAVHASYNLNLDGKQNGAALSLSPSRRVFRRGARVGGGHGSDRLQQLGQPPRGRNHFRVVVQLRQQAGDLSLLVFLLLALEVLEGLMCGRIANPNTKMKTNKEERKL